jgi:integrase/recombinase XerC
MDIYIGKFLDFLQKEKHYSQHTVLAYTDDVLAFQNFIERTFQTNDLLTVVYPQVRNWIVSLLDEGISNVSINRKISSLKAFYLFLRKIKAIDASPLLQHKALKTPKNIQIPFSEKELDNVLNQITFPNNFEGNRDKLIIDLFYSTGIRRAELINIKVFDVQTQNQTLKVLGKRNKERILPLLPKNLHLINNYLKQRADLEIIKDLDYFFLSKKGIKLSESLVYRIINHYFSGVSEKVKKSPHILRHTFATHLLNNGADLNSVKELLGHSSLASTQVYTHSSLATLKQVYEGTHPRNAK